MQRALLSVVLEDAVLHRSPDRLQDRGVLVRVTTAIAGESVRLGDLRFRREPQVEQVVLAILHLEELSEGSDDRASPVARRRVCIGFATGWGSSPVSSRYNPRLSRSRPASAKIAPPSGNSGGTASSLAAEKARRDHGVRVREGLRGPADVDLFGRARHGRRDAMPILVPDNPPFPPCPQRAKAADTAPRAPYRPKSRADSRRRSRPPSCDRGDRSAPDPQRAVPGWFPGRPTP